MIYPYTVQLKGENTKYQWKTYIIKKNVDIAHFLTKKPSFSSSLFLVFIPPGAEYPPNLLSDLMTLWQGIWGAYGFLPQALATALADLGWFIAIATSL